MADDAMTVSATDGNFSIFPRWREIYCNNLNCMINKKSCHPKTYCFVLEFQQHESEGFGGLPKWSLGVKCGLWKWKIGYSSMSESE